MLMFNASTLYKVNVCTYIVVVVFIVYQYQCTETTAVLSFNFRHILYLLKLGICKDRQIR